MLIATRAGYLLAATCVAIISGIFLKLSRHEGRPAAAALFPRPCGEALLQGRRRQMEDFVVCSHSQNISVYAVFDGHEGDEAASFAAEHLHKAFFEAVQESRVIASRAMQPSLQLGFEQALHSAFRDTNRLFLELAERQALDGGTTAVVAVGFGDRILVAHAGDSRAMLCSMEAGTGAVHARVVTEDHSPGAREERRRILAAGGTVQQDAGGRWRLDGELSVSRSLGDLPYIPHGLSAEATLSEWIQLSPAASEALSHQWLVLASDGIFESMQPGEVCEAAHAFASGKPPQQSPPAPEAIALPSSPGETGSSASDVQDVSVPDDLHRPVLEAESGAATNHRMPGDTLLSRGKVLSRHSFSEQNSEQQPSLEQQVADWLVREAYNRRSMDNIAVVAIDLRPPAQELEPTSEAVGADQNTRLSFPGSQHWYELHSLVERLPHLHGEQKGLIVLRPGYELQTRWGQAMPWALTCLAEPQVADDESIPRSGLDTSGLISRLAVLPMAWPNEPPTSPETAAEGLPKRLEGNQGPVRGTSDGRWGAQSGLGQHWKLEGQIGQGSFGEVWHASRVGSPDRGDVGREGGYVLKRIRSDGGKQDGRRLSLLREAYFGRLINNLAAHLDLGSQQGVPLEWDGRNHIVRYVESFESGEDFCLVLRNEGISLHDLMYSPAELPGACPECSQGQAVLLEASEWWTDLRRGDHGDGFIRELLRQLLLALDTLHSANITHRDVKPENLLVSFEEPPGAPPQPHLRLIDLGSAVDPLSARELYGSKGPSPLEHTQEYAPPEALLGRYWGEGSQSRESRPFDMWSVGITWLEWILGTPHVFGISERQRVMLHQALHLDRQTTEERDLAYWLRGVMQLCIYPPLPRNPQLGRPRERSKRGNSSEVLDAGGGNGRPVVAWSCAEEAVLTAIKEKDRLGIGLPNPVALRLLQVLLHWNPAARPTPRQALQHSFFTLEASSQNVQHCHNDPNLPGWC